MTTIDAIQVSSPPWVDLYISGLPAPTASLEVVRVWNGTRTRVRGDSTAPIYSSDARLVDWAAPVGVGTLTYEVTPLDSSDTALEAATSVSVTATTVADSKAWVSDPYDPTGAVLVTLLRGEPDQGMGGAGGFLATITGLPLGLTATRSIRTRRWRLLTSTSTEEASLAVVMASTGLLIRAEADLIDHETGIVYLSAPDLSRGRRMPRRDGVVWDFPATETRGPSAPPAIADRTYQDDLDQYPTYQDSLDAQATYLDRLRG